MTSSPTVERLVAHVFAGAAHGDASTAELAAWLMGSPRFRAFVEAHRDKIRRKLRGAADEDARRDVRAELRVAHLLLTDRRLDLAFEAYGSGRPGPDFTVAFRGARVFNLEVTRLRRAPEEAGFDGTLLAKLRQLPPSMPNVLLVAIPGDRADRLDVAAAARALRARADAGDEAFFAARRVAGTREFYHRFLRLGGMLVWCEGAEGDARAALWRNPSARIALPERAVTACLTSLRAA